MKDLHHAAERGESASAKAILTAWRKSCSVDYCWWLQRRVKTFVIATIIGLIVGYLVYVLSGEIVAVVGMLSVGLLLAHIELSKRLEEQCQLFNRRFDQVLKRLVMDGKEYMHTPPEDLIFKYKSHLQSLAKLVKLAESDPAKVIMEYELDSSLDPRTWARSKFQNSFTLGRVFGLVTSERWKPYF